MQRSRAALLILVILLPVMVTGCGTVVSMFNEPGPYSGVKCDVAGWETLALADWPWPKNLQLDWSNDSKYLAVFVGFWLTRPIWVSAVLAADILLSAIADTLILPFTMSPRQKSGTRR